MSIVRAHCVCVCVFVNDVSVRTSERAKRAHRHKSMFQQRSVVIYEPAMLLQTQMKFAIKTHRFGVDMDHTDCVDVSLWFRILQCSFDLDWKRENVQNYSANNFKVKKFKQIYSKLHSNRTELFIQWENFSGKNGSWIWV